MHIALQATPKGGTRTTIGQRPHHRQAGPTTPASRASATASADCWAEALLKIARMTLTIKRDGNWSSFQLANSALPLSVTSSAIAPSARMPHLAGALAKTPPTLRALVLPREPPRDGAKFHMAGESFKA